MPSVSKTILISILLSAQPALSIDTEIVMDRKGLDIQFINSERHEVGNEEQRHIIDIIAGSERKIRALLPDLPNDISVTVTFVDKDFNHWGTSMGLNGRADAPGVVTFDISTRFPGGISEVVNKNLALLVFHEFHHLARGWTISGNKFGQGIPIATVNEGLAVVFSEQYAAGTFEKLACPENGELWLTEIMTLATDASYGQWMNQNTDGRFSIGYRTGKYVVKKAMAVSGKNILDLSRLSPDEILALVIGTAP